MYVFPAGQPLAHYSRGLTTLDELVLHESVTSSRQATVDVLSRRKLGVHIIVDRDGSVTQHAPLDAACAHAEGFGRPSLHNERSIALEVVNPYYGARAGAGEDTIEAVWAHRGVYILPTPVQMHTLWDVVVELWRPRLTAGPAACFPGWQRVAGLGPRRFVWGRVNRHEVPGIMAHARWAHSDGLFPEHYLLLRALGHHHADAYQLTVDAASSGKRRTVVPELAGGGS